MIDVTLTATLLIASTTVTVSSTSKLYVGMFLYGTGITVCTKIESIDSSTTLTVTKNPTADGDYSIVFSDMSPNQYLERCHALKCSQGIIESIGTKIEVIVRNESQVTRDSYGNIKRKTQENKVYISAININFSPTNDQLEHAGLREECEVSLETSTQSWTDQSLSFSDIDRERSTIKINGITYEIKEKTQANQFNNTFLNINMGLSRK